MKHIDIRFIVMALVYAVFGMVLGLWMGANEDYTHVPLHAHVNLVGWASMALFGLIYRAWPDLGAGRLAALQFWLMALGTPVMLVGIPLAHGGGSPLPAIAGSAMVIVGFVLFLAIFLRGSRVRA